MDMGM